MKKTLYMIAASLLLFFALAFLDEYETLILPLFKEEAKAINMETGSDFKAESLAPFLKSFNEQLSEAYRASNPGKAWELPADPQLQRSVHDELVYNLTNKVKVASRLTELLVLSIKTISPSSVRVIALETTVGGEGGVSKRAVAYVVQKKDNAFLVISMESVDEGDAR